MVKETTTTRKTIIAVEFLERPFNTKLLRHVKTIFKKLHQSRGKIEYIGINFTTFNLLPITVELLLFSFRFSTFG